MRAVVAIVAACACGACGRFGFEAERGDASSGASDGLHGDALPGDAAPGDGPTDGVDASLGCAPFDLCDAFETPTFSAPWMTGVSVRLDGVHVHSGTQAVHVKTPGIAANSSGYSQIVETTVLGASGTTTWVRAWFYLSGLPAGTNHMELISVESAGGSKGDYLFSYATETAIYSDYSTGTSANPPAPPVGQWFCAVFALQRDDTSTGGQLDLTGEGLPPLTEQTMTDSAADPLASVALGIGFAATNVTTNQPAIDMWIDDVIVHHAPITCADGL